MCIINEKFNNATILACQTRKLLLNDCFVLSNASKYFGQGIFYLQWMNQSSWNLLDFNNSHATRESLHGKSDQKNLLEQMGMHDHYPCYFCFKLLKRFPHRLLWFFCCTSKASWRCLSSSHILRCFTNIWWHCYSISSMQWKFLMRFLLGIV